jgi:putative transposase
VKCWKKVLTREISSRLKETNLSVAEKFGVQIIEQETDLDHIHILFASRPLRHFAEMQQVWNDRT